MLVSARRRGDRVGAGFEPMISSEGALAIAAPAADAAVEQKLMGYCLSVNGL